MANGHESTWFPFKLIARGHGGTNQPNETRRRWTRGQSMPCSLAARRSRPIAAPTLPLGADVAHWRSSGRRRNSRSLIQVTWTHAAPNSPPTPRSRQSLRSPTGPSGAMSISAAPVAPAAELDPSSAARAVTRPRGLRSPQRSQRVRARPAAPWSEQSGARPSTTSRLTAGRDRAPPIRIRL
jgi:hypothetical protein